MKEHLNENVINFEVIDKSEKVLEKVKWAKDRAKKLSHVQTPTTTEPVKPVAYVRKVENHLPSAEKPKTASATTKT